MNIRCGRRPRSLIVRVALSVVVSVVIIGGFPNPSQAAGIYTHSWFVEESINQLTQLEAHDKKSYSELKDILDRHSGYVNYGAIFPDVGAKAIGDQGWSECYLHDTDTLRYVTYRTLIMGSGSSEDLFSESYRDLTVPPFRRALINQLTPLLRKSLRTSEDEEMIAFLFGFIAHQVADVPWHWQASNEADGVSGVEEKLEMGMTSELSYDQLLYFEDKEGSSVQDFGPLSMTYPLNKRLTDIIRQASTNTGKVWCSGDPSPTYAQYSSVPAPFVLSFGIDWSKFPPVFFPIWTDPLDVANGAMWLYSTGVIRADRTFIIPLVSKFNSTDAARDWLMNYEPGGIYYGAKLTAVAWAETWDTMANETVTTIVHSPELPDGENGWYRQQVSVEMSAPEAKATYYRLDGGDFQTYNGEFRITEEGIHQIEYYSEDNIGNHEEVKLDVVKIDWTAPEISGAATTQPNGNGWYNSPVTAHFEASDTGSGLISVSPDVNLPGEGSGQSASGMAVDEAGNTAIADVTGINIDMTPPTIIGYPTTQANTYGWYNTDVSVHFEARDDLSGLDTVTPDQTLSTEGAEQSVVGTAIDLAGNSASYTRAGLNIDKSAPIIVIDSPKNETYQNTDTPQALWVVSDDLSGVEAEGAAWRGSPVANGAILDLLLIPAGPEKFVVTAADRAGNQAAQSVTFTVGVNLDGLQATLNKICSTKMIAKSGSCHSLLVKIEAAIRSVDKGNTNAASKQLHAFLNELRTLVKKSITKEVYILLKTDVDFILTQMQ